MPDALTANAPTADALSAADQAVLQRRGFLRGGALLAAVAGGAVVATAGSVLPASAEPLPFGAVILSTSPERLLDTKTTDGRSGIVGSSSPTALTGGHRLRKGAWIDVAIVPVDVFPVSSVFVNLTSLSSLKGGYLTVSLPGDEQPTGTTLYHSKGKTVSNSALVPVDVVDGSFAVRIFASATTHVTLDITGLTIFANTIQPDLRKSAQNDADKFRKALQAARR